MPEKPSIDGLEDRWSAAWEEQGTYRFDRTQAARGDLLDRHAAASPRAARCTSATSSPTPTPTWSPATSGCAGARCSTRWAGTTTGCPASGGCRTTTACAAIRRCPTTRTSRRPPTAAKSKEQVPISRRNFVELCDVLTAEDEKAYESVWRRLALSVDWSSPYRDDRRALAGDLAEGVPAQPRPRRRLPGARRRRCGTSRSGPRWRRPSSRTASGPAPTTGSRSAGDGGEPLRVETTRPELLPACVALVAHPDDERYQPLFGTTVRTPVFGVEVPVVAHRLAAPGQGHRHRDGLHVRRRDRRDLVARALARRPARCSAPTAACCPTRRTGVDAAAYARIAGKTVFSAREETVAMLREAGALEGEPTPITHPVKFFEKGDRPLEIVTTRQWYLRNGGRDADLRETLLERGRELRLAPAAHAGALRTLGRGPHRRLADQPAAVLRRAVPGLVPRSTTRASRSTTSRCVPDESALPVDPSSDCPPGYDESAARRAGRLHRRPGRHGHLGDVVAVAADRRRLDLRRRPVLAGVPDGPAAAGPGHHPHLAVLDGRARPTRSSACCRGPTPRSAAGSSTRTARRCRSPRATSSPRSRCSRSSAPTRSATGRRQRGSGTDAAFDTGQMKIGRRLAIKILNASKFALDAGCDAGPRRGHRAARPGAARRASRGSSSEATAAFDDYNHTRALEVTETLLLDVLRRLRRAGQGAGVRRPRGRRRRLGEGHARHGARRAAPAVRAVPAVRDRGGLVVVARGLGAPRRLAG